MNSKAKTIFLFLILGICFLLPAALIAAEKGFTGQITANGINVRVDSTAGSEAICSLSKGEIVEVVQEAYDWYKIRLPKEAPSYVRKDLLECTDVSRPNTGPDFAAQSQKCQSAKVARDRINIRLSPSESAWIIGKLDRDTVVNVISESGGWYKIHPVYQSFGWVNKRFVSKEIVVAKPVEPAKEVKEEAAGQLVVEGKVSPYGIVLWRKATHKLITAENKLYFLTGERKILDSLNYRKVKVSGKIIAEAEDKRPIIKVDVIQALD